ncbi:MAG: hypothetical protein KDA87_23755, partial [Planctomycetales bacterium]|nr:hypothetical protein [Planctomycetales bacterium]
MSRLQNVVPIFISCGVCLLAVSSVFAAEVKPPVGFDSGTTEGWIAGQAFANPTLQSSGGPQGDGDPFLLIVGNGGNGPGSIPAAFNNNPEWTGDYVTPGINTLSVDMMNTEESNSLQMRLVLFGPNNLNTRWTSVDFVTVPNDGVWRNYQFPIDEASLTRVAGNGTFENLLGSVSRIMLRHDSGSPSRGGSAARANLGIDNIAFLAGIIGDYNGNNQLDAGDLDLQAIGIAANDLAFDLDGNGQTNMDDRTAWIRDLQKSWVGDSNFDGEFNSSDFVAVFSVGKYETGAMATYAEGDWNGDQLFDSSDFVAAFQDGGFEQGPRIDVASVPEPTS